MLPCLKQYIKYVDIGPAFLYKVGLSHEHVLKGFVIFLKKGYSFIIVAFYKDLIIIVYVLYDID